MQNSNYSIICSKNNIINIKSEILYREAEDDFFYFNNINSAYKKLCTAVKLTPYHLKSVILLADICYIKGFMKKALNLYFNAYKVNSKNPKILSAIANCYYAFNDNKKAIEYAQFALKNINSDDLELLAQINELIINSYIKEKQYSKAQSVYQKIQQELNFKSIKFIYNLNYELLIKKLEIQNKLKKSHLKIV